MLKYLKRLRRGKEYSNFQKVIRLDIIETAEQKDDDGGWRLWHFCALSVSDTSRPHVSAFSLQTQGTQGPPKRAERDKSDTASAALRLPKGKTSTLQQHSCRVSSVAENSNKMCARIFQIKYVHIRDQLHSNVTAKKHNRIYNST